MIDFDKLMKLTHAVHVEFHKPLAWYKNVFSIFKRKKDMKDIDNILWEIDYELTLWVADYVAKNNIDFVYYANNYLANHQAFPFSCDEGEYLALYVNQDQKDCEFHYLIDEKSRLFYGVIHTTKKVISDSEKIEFINFFKKKFSGFNRQSSIELNTIRDQLKSLSLPEYTQLYQYPASIDTHTIQSTVPLLDEQTVKAYLFPQSECDMIKTEDDNKLENSKLLPSQCLKLTLK